FYPNAYNALTRKRKGTQLTTLSACFYGAGDRNRTDDPLITNHILWHPAASSVIPTILATQ
ncbi:MAG: hypothetical protein ACYDDR_13295, partial [Acidithiobacillus ferrivorans]